MLYLDVPDGRVQVRQVKGFLELFEALLQVSPPVCDPRAVLSRRKCKKC